MANLVVGNQASVDYYHYSTGYLDDIFTVFRRHNHPVVVIEGCAFAWMGLAVRIEDVRSPKNSF